MSVLAEAISVIIRRTSLDHRYPGGAEQYWRDCPNQTFCADGYLTRVGFMAPEDVGAFIDYLSRHGLVHVRNRSSVDISVVDQFRGATAPCDWLEVRLLEEGYSIAWLAGTEPKLLSYPPEWTPERSPSLQFVDTDEAKEGLLRLGSESKVGIVLDYKTGKQVYIGRVTPPDGPSTRRRDLRPPSAGEL